MTELDGGWISQRPDGWETDDPDWGLVEEQSPASSWFDRLRRPEVTIVLTLAASLGAVAALAAFKGSDALKSLKQKPAPALLTGACPQPSQKSIDTVERLFTEPVAKARAEYRQLPLDGYATEGSLMLPNLWGTTGQELLHYTEPYFQKYKIGIEVASAPEKPIYDLHAPTQKEVNGPDFSNNVLGMVAGLSEVPPHYVLMSGLRKIVLVAGRGNAEYAWAEPHTLYWNIDTPEPNSDPVPFEFGMALGHFTEDRLCGPDGTNNDPAFVAAGKGPLASPIAPSSEDGSVTPLWNYEAGNASAAKVNAIDERAAAGISVDKAEILSLVANPGLVSAAMSPDHPLLRSKVVETLAELYQRQPAVVRRLAVKAAQYPLPGGLSHPSPAGNRPDPVDPKPRY